MIISLKILLSILNFSTVSHSFLFQCMRTGDEIMSDVGGKDDYVLNSSLFFAVLPRVIYSMTSPSCAERGTCDITLRELRFALFFAHHYCAINSSKRILRKYRKHALKMQNFAKMIKTGLKIRKKWEGARNLRETKRIFLENF